MAKLSVEDLKRIKEDVLKSTSLREGGKRVKITVHMGTCGIASGARDVLKSAMDEIGDSGAEDIIVTTSGCMGICSREPLVTVEVLDEKPVVYEYVDNKKMRQIFKQHVLNGKVQADFAMAVGREGEE
jgi:NADP-reducing hydrogenase subunit HndB